MADLAIKFHLAFLGSLCTNFASRIFTHDFFGRLSTIKLSWHHLGTWLKLSWNHIETTIETTRVYKEPCGSRTLKPHKMDTPLKINILHIIMEIWKIIFLSTRVSCRFRPFIFQGVQYGGFDTSHRRPWVPRSAMHSWELPPRVFTTLKTTSEFDPEKRPGKVHLPIIKFQRVVSVSGRILGPVLGAKISV